MRKTIVGLGVGSRHDPTRPCRAACLGRKRHCRRRFRACQPVISVPITESDREFRYRTEGRSCLASTRRWLRSCGRRRVDAIDCVVFTGLLGLLAPKHGFDRARFSVFCSVLPWQQIRVGDTKMRGLRIRCFGVRLVRKCFLYHGLPFSVSSARGMGASHCSQEENTIDVPIGNRCG